MVKKKSKFIVFEGIDGSGKSTAISFLKNFFNKQSIQFLCTHEPGGTPLSEKIRKLLKFSIKNENFFPESELLLIYASRIQNIRKIIKPALDDNKLVISDRFIWSTLAYQGGGKKISLNKIKEMNNLFIPNLLPDLIIYLDIDPILAMKRIILRGKKKDKFEKEDIHFFNRARKIFLNLIKENRKNSILIDGNNSIECIQKKIIDELYEKEII